MRLFRSKSEKYPSTLDEESLYAAAAEEVAQGRMRSGLYAMALADADGDETKARARYLKLRVEAMKRELRAAGEPDEGGESRRLDVTGQPAGQREEVEPPAAATQAWDALYVRRGLAVALLLFGAFVAGIVFLVKDLAKTTDPSPKAPPPKETGMAMPDPGKELGKMLAEKARELGKQVPQKLDSELEVWKVSATDDALIYHLMFTKRKASEQLKMRIEAGMPNVKAAACGDPSLRKVFKMGGSVKYAYTGKDQVPIAEVVVLAEDCGA